MDFITSFFDNFTIVSYATLLIVALCLLISGNLSISRENSPLWSIVVGNIAFWYFIRSIPGNFDTSIIIIAFISAACICWFLWMKVDENQTNEDRGFSRSGKQAITNGYNDVKDHMKNKASETVGGGFFGDLVGSAIDLGTRKADGHLSGVLEIFGDSDEYINPVRGTINLLRNLILISMLIIMIFMS